MARSWFVLTAGDGWGDDFMKLLNYFRGQRNRFVWHYQQWQRNERCRGFYKWMKKRHGAHFNPEWNWRVNGTLCTVWTEPMRLKIYHDKGRSVSHYELTEELGQIQARIAVVQLERQP